MAKHRQKKAKKAAIAGAAVATAVSVAVAPGVAQALSSQTYFVGFPSWLPIGAGSTLPSDPDAIESAIVAAHDKDPLVGWGTGGVPLNPVWVNWYNPAIDVTKLTDPSYLAGLNVANFSDPTKDQYYTTQQQVITGYQPVQQTNPAYTAALNAAKADIIAQDTASILTPSTLTISYKLFGSTRTATIPNPFQNQPDRLNTLLTTGSYSGNTSILGVSIPYTINLSQLVGNSDWDTRAAQAVAAQGIPQTVTVQQPVYDTLPGYWTTNAFGQWVSPTNDVAQLDGLLGLGGGTPDLSALEGLTLKDLAYYQTGDQGFLAPYLNWTTYLTNVNLIAYGEGSIAVGEAYRQYIEAAQQGLIPVGVAKTDGLAIVLDKDGNPVLVQKNKDDGGLFDFPTDLDYPDVPLNEDGTPKYPGFVKTPGGVIDVTLLSMILIRNPGRANGGIDARFAPIYQALTGINPVSPERTDVLPAGINPDTFTKLLNGDVSNISVNDLGDLVATLKDANGKNIVITLKADVGWEYDLMSDAPATANPVAWANSVASALFLTNLITGLDLKNLGSGAYVGPDGTLYYTIPVNDLPLLAPLRAPAQVLGLLTGNLDPNTPVADAIEPFLKILVNTSYTDAVRNEDGTWTRSLDEFDVPTLFGTETLTRQQQAQVAGDLIAALGSGVGDESNQVLVDALKKVVTALKLDVDPAQQAEVAKALTAPGKALKEVTRDVGDGVTKALSDVEPYLPKSPIDRSQAGLAKDQAAVGKVLAGARDDLNEAVANVNKTAGDVQQKNYQNQVAVRESLTKVGIKTPAPLTPAERKAKNQAAAAKTSANLKKVGDDIKKAVNDTVDKVKKAVSGD